MLGLSCPEVEIWECEVGGGASLCNFNALISLTVGNKDDDPERKTVETQDAKRFADQMGIELFETSAKENKNVEEVMIEATRCAVP